jgi:hypothetical protein
MKEKHRHPQFSTKGLVAHYKLQAGLTSTSEIFDYSLNGNTGTLSGTDIAPAYPGFSFNGTDDKITTASGSATIRTVLAWIKPTSIAGTDNIVTLNGAESLRVVAGTLTEVAFPGSQVLYVDGIAGVGITTDWHLAGITVSENVDGSTLQIGNKSTLWFGGKIGEVMFYDRVLMPTEFKSIYELTKWRYPNN